MSTRKLLFINLIFCITIIIILSYQYLNKENFIYVSSQQVFESFKMTHDVKVIGDKTLDKRNGIIDSLYNELQSPLNSSSRDIIMQKIIFEKESLEEFNNNFSTQETNKIWARIHSYASDYAVMNNYKFIFGAQPNYNIIHGDKDSDKTEDFLTYINNRYEGLK